MSSAVLPRLMTTEELLALPDDGLDRDLIFGQLRERPMTKRNRRHSRVMARLGELLLNWLERQSPPHGEVVVGETGFRLRRDPDFTVGIDLALISAEQAAANPDGAAIIEGSPLLAVEILSPSDKHEDIREKIEGYLECGVPLVWEIDPDFRTVKIHRPGEEPVLVNRKQELSAEPQLPGFRIAMTELFPK